MDGSYRSVFLYEDRVLELAPIPGFWPMLRRVWTRMSLYGNWLVVHMYSNVHADR